MINVVIPNYNGLRYLETLLPTLEAQTYSQFDVTVVDNGSTDGSAESLKSRGARVIELEKNRGFAAACNVGARETNDDAIFFLNSDTQLDRRCMKTLAAALENHPQCGFFAPRMVSLTDRDMLDGAGDVIPKDGRPVKRAAGMSASTPLDAEIIAPSGGAALWRRGLFESLNGFDEDFFAYLEDVDLGFRARLAGARGRYVPEGIVYHLGAGAQMLDTRGLSPLSVTHPHDNPDVVRWVARNKIWLWARCLPTRVIIRHAPSLALGLIKSAAHHILRSGQGAAFFAGTMQGLAGLPHALQKRKFTQSTKAVTDREVGKWIKTASRSW